MIYIALIAVAITIARYTLAVRHGGTLRVLWELAAAALAGLAAGLWFGIAARAAMRIVALGAGAPLRLSAGGTVQVVLVFAGIGGAVAILYAGLFRHALATSGFRFGMLLFLGTWFPFTQAAEDIIARDVNPFASGLVTLLMWMPYALLLERLTPPLVRRFTQIREAAAA